MEKNPKDILIQVKEFFNTLMAPAPVAPVAPVAMGTEYTLQDGTTKVTIDKLEAGGIVKIKDMTGAESVAPAGEHTLQDGTVLVVAEGGVISEVRAVAPAAPAAPVLPAPMTVQQMRESVNHNFAVGTIEDRITALEAMVKGLMLNCMSYEIKETAADDAIEAYKTSIEGMEVAMKEQKENTMKVMQGVLEAVELLATQPTAAPDPVVIKKNIFKTEDKTVSETVNNISKILFKK